MLTCIDAFFKHFYKNNQMKHLKKLTLIGFLFLAACTGETDKEPTKAKETPLSKYYLVLEKEGIKKQASVSSERSVNYGGSAQTNAVRFKVQGAMLNISNYYEDMNAGIDATIGKEYEAEMRVEGIVSKGKAKLVKI